MNATRTIDEVNQNYAWMAKLQTKIPDELLHLRDYNGRYYWDKVDEKNLKYFINQCSHQPWGNHFSLAILCLTDRNLTPSSVHNITSSLNARFRDIFKHFDLKSMNELSFVHIEKYLNSEILLDHTDRQRQNLLTGYNTFIFNLKKWLGTQFEENDRIVLNKYLLFDLPFDNRDFNVRTKAINDSKTKRKEDTSAITPLLPEIRAEGSIRYNQIKRLREVYQNVIKRVRCEKLRFPVEFYYDESEYTGERWHFQLINLRDFSNGEFVERFTYREFNDNDCVVEFIKAEKLDDGSTGEGPWFLDILKLRLIGNWLTEYTSREHKEKVITYLNNWGYEIEENGKIPAPFLPRNPGLLIQGFETTRIANLSNKLLINIEPIYIACMFAKFSFDLITSSGARINELLQISHDKECCVVTVDNSIDPPKKNYIFRLTPKGREEPENYYMPEEIFKFMLEILKTLKESYGSKQIPEVEYAVDSRKHLMSNKRYIFQYNSRHINVFTINAIMRFLLHGIIIQNSEGHQVVVRAHLLRHAFATHAVQTEKLPIDIVKNMLHQKDIEVTEYYSAPTSQQISNSIQQLHENWISYIDIQKGILRSPVELQEQYEDYSKKVGTLSKVVGGICTIDSVCPTKMACIGCSAKVPQPEYQDEISAYHTWADESEKRFEKLGLPLEAQKMKLAKNRAKIELSEIKLIERARIDETYKPKININSK